jgi:hypothetical protein
MGQRVAGRAVGLLALACAVVGFLVVAGISIAFPGITLNAVAYYFSLTSEDRPGQVLAIVAAVLNVASMVVSGL